MSIAEVKKFVESWIVDAKKDSVAVIDKPIQICGVTLPKDVVDILKAHYFVECEERANQILQMLEDVDRSPKREPMPKATGRAARDAVRLFTGTLHEYAPDWDALLFTSQNDWERAEQAIIAPYAKRIAELETAVRTENEFYKQSVHREGELRSMLESVLARERDRVAELEKKLTEVSMPEPSASPNRDRLKQTDNTQETRRGNRTTESKSEHEPDPVGSVKRYLADGGRWD